MPDSATANPGPEAKARCGLFASTQAEPAKQPAKGPGKRLFDSEYGRACAAKAHEAKRKKAQAVADFAANPYPRPDDSPDSQPAEAPLDPWSTKRLMRVRRQLTRVDDLVDALLSGENPTAAQVAELAGAADRLAAASSKLEEQERRLSSRSLPPVLRAIEKQSKRGMLNDLPE